MRVSYHRPFIIGLNGYEFDKLLHMIEPFSKEDQCLLGLSDKLTLTLMRMRHNVSFHLLEFLTGLSDTTLQRYFDEVLNMIYQVRNYFKKSV